LLKTNGFGNYLNKKSAAKVGLLPRTLAEKSLAVGNAALAGASMLLLNSELRSTSEDISKSAKILELSTNPIFSDKYISGMMLGEV